MSANAVAKHYDQHLGPIYEWMAGDFEAGMRQADKYFDSIQLMPPSLGTAVDLGCGHGLHALPLARRGFHVIAIDRCQTLLQRLASRKGELTLDIVEDDLLNFTQHLPAQVEAIVCMGDTLTHLASQEEVRQLLSSASQSLVHGGLLCISFRDYVSSELREGERFIPVHSDLRRIHTCFLEYQPQIVIVHDVIYNLTDDGWKISVSAYPKIRLDPAWVVETAKALGLELRQHSIERGMLHYAFENTNKKAA